jgi:hypothetical protein
MILFLKNVPRIKKGIRKLVVRFVAKKYLFGFA